MQKPPATWQQIWQGRRRVNNRRQFCYSACIPERRASKDRRSGNERRDLPHRPPDWRYEVNLTA